MGDIYKVIVLFLLTAAFTDGACSFPSEIRGSWISAEKGALWFNETEIFNYPMEISQTVKSLDLDCMDSKDLTFTVKSKTTVKVLGRQEIYVYICLVFVRVSEYKYYYYVGSKKNTIDDRLFPRPPGVNVTLEDSCDRPEPYESGNFVLLLKENAVTDGLAAATCPLQLLHSYQNVTISDETGTTCIGNVFDACNDKSIMNYTYSDCSSGKVFSAAGTYTCLFSLEDGNTTYLSAWNNDNTTDGKTSYRFTCFAIWTDEIGNVVATENPKICSVSQTPSAVTSPGLLLSFSDTKGTCYQAIDHPSSLGYYILIAVLILMVPAVILMIYYIRKVCLKSDEPEDDVLSRAPRVPSAAPRDTRFRMRKMVKQTIVEPSIEPPAKVQPLYINTEYPDEDPPLYRSPSFSIFPI